MTDRSHTPDLTIAHLVLVDVQIDALKQAVVELSESAAVIMAQGVDVSSSSQMEALAEKVQKRFGAPHLVFNNAGVSGGGLLWENTVAEWEWLLGVDLWGVIHGVRLFVPMMLDESRVDSTWCGHIVNTASMAGLVAPPNMGVYNTAKAAVVQLTETLYHDLHLVTNQIGVSLLCPYFVSTNIADSVRHQPPAVSEERATKSQRISRTMLERAVRHGRVSAGEVARKVFSAVEDNRFYVFSHEGPGALGNISLRIQHMVDGKNPVDPFVQTPEIGASLREQLR